MSKRILQQLYKHGNCTAVTIPRYLLFELGWLPNRGVIVELLEDKSGVIVRVPHADDFGPVRAPRLTRDEQAVTK